ncbi:hypothetical protein Mal15_21870 [Stieleria maiorica]|uniref:Uncharacterized protein n=1 Tax=Stieleria maiorica TaxID=2795974 RepID=A0A5B9MCA5_9BACT|nr:hypothetical protein [Stieleria maiorica]QEF98139.1 hypothetical protein Mal15_21870 [Stieleria maiorica]
MKTASQLSFDDLRGFVAYVHRLTFLEIDDDGAVIGWNADKSLETCDYASHIVAAFETLGMVPGDSVELNADDCGEGGE